MKTLLLFISSTMVMIAFVLVISLVLGKTPRLTERAARTTQPQRAIWLAQARVSMTPRQYWATTFASGAVTFLFITAFSQTPLIAFVIGLSASAIPYMCIAKKRAAISRELINAWPDALRDISASLSAGYSLSIALHTLGQIGPASIGPHMKRFTVLERSVGFSAALELVREEMNDATTDRIIEVLIVANERGGRVVRDIIDNLIEATTDDIALAETIATESIEMKINSRAVVILPWCVLLLLTMSGGIFRDFYRSSAGAVVIFIGALMSLAGIAILTRLTRTDLEQRVFASSDRSS